MGADPGDEALDLVVGVRGAGRERTRRVPGHAGVGVRQLEVLPRRGGAGVALAGAAAVAELLRCGAFDVGLHRVDGAGPEADGRHDGAGVGGEQVARAGTTPRVRCRRGTPGSETTARCRRSAGRSRAPWDCPAPAAARTGRTASPRRDAVRVRVRRRPVGAVPVVEGLPDPVRRALGPHPHDHGGRRDRRAARCRGGWRSRGSRPRVSGRRGCPAWPAAPPGHPRRGRRGRAAAGPTRRWRGSRSRPATCGAGKATSTAQPATATVPKVAARPRPPRRPPSLAELHIASSPTMPNASQAST